MKGCDILKLLAKILTGLLVVSIASGVTFYIQETRVEELQTELFKANTQLKEVKVSNEQYIKNIKETEQKDQTLQTTLKEQKNELQQKDKEIKKLTEELQEKQAQVAATNAVAQSSEQKTVQEEKEPAATESQTSEVKKPVSRSVNTSTYQASFSAYYPADDALQGGGITATGHNLYTSRFYNGYRVIACPPNIPFGTIFQIEVTGVSGSLGSFQAVCLDRGGAIQMEGNTIRIDIATDGHDEAYGFGRQYGTATIIGKI